MSLPIAISTTLENLALGVSTSQATLVWPLASPALPNGGTAQYIQIDNIGSVTAFVRVAPETDTIVVPGSSTVGNCFPIAPNGSVTVQVIPDKTSAAITPFNDGNGNLAIDAITNDGTTIIVVTPVQVG
jgi:hypothetical protein